MKTFGFCVHNEKKFVNFTCNLILIVTAFCVMSLSFFAPIVTEAFSTATAPYHYGDKSSNKVSLMINVYWGTEYLDEMLEVLKVNDVKTTFFVGGYWVAKNNEMLRKIVLDGHEIGNHGYHHKDQATISTQQNIDEIYMTQELVKSVADVEMDLFAPPSGSYNNKVLSVAESLGYKTIMWTHDTIDWRDKDSELIFQRATKNTVGGDLILMHPTQKTAEALQEIITTLKEKGLVLTTVTDALGG
ncbi:MAG: polysaccharide deacetylase [Clostridia bacterium]|nr:polysaccharide deacetylase [Clostridia bacterium]